MSPAGWMGVSCGWWRMNLLQAMMCEQGLPTSSAPQCLQMPAGLDSNPTTGVDSKMKCTSQYDSTKWVFWCSRFPSSSTVETDLGGRS